MALPSSTGPIRDQTGAACADGQSGPVWYLAGTFGGPVTRSCTVPKHKFIYLPLKNHWVAPRLESVDTPEEMANYLAFVDEWIPLRRAISCNLRIELDGVPLLDSQEEIDAKLWTQRLTPFEAVLNADNSNGFPGGISPAVTHGGYYALLLPMAPGSTHTLVFGGANCNDDGSVAFETLATYNLTIGN
jgi:hypothetical protein